MSFISPTVSVVMPVYNAETTLERAVNSVLAQDFADWELLLAEDGSSDGSAALAGHLAETDSRIRVLKGTVNSGAARARNRAIAESQGRYIAFLDADDEWLPKKLSKQIDFMQANKVAFSYTSFFRVRNGVRHQVHVPRCVDYEKLLRGNLIGCLTVVLDAHVLGRQEMPDLQLRQDYAMWLKLLRRIPLAFSVPEPLALHHQQKKSLSSNKLRALRATWQLYRDVEGLSPLKAAQCLSSHLWQRVNS